MIINITNDLICEIMNAVREEISEKAQHKKDVLEAAHLRFDCMGQYFFKTAYLEKTWRGKRWSVIPLEVEYLYDEDERKVRICVYIVKHKKPESHTDQTYSVEWFSLKELRDDDLFKAKASIFLKRIITLFKEADTYFKANEKLKERLCF